ncbi:hypothetical protein [Gallaecimonas pentaromativorans]|uniref:hypothetical protein n=1 Tax=Gallaecimonas pentaromativorans TaxID=584787 RepID=UPI003A91A6E2
MDWLLTQLDWRLLCADIALVAAYPFYRTRLPGNGVTALLAVLGIVPLLAQYFWLHWALSALAAFFILAIEGHLEQREKNHGTGCALLVILVFALGASIGLHLLINLTGRLAHSQLQGGVATGWSALVLSLYGLCALVACAYTFAAWQSADSEQSLRRYDMNVLLPIATAILPHFVPNFGLGLALGAAICALPWLASWPLERRFGPPLAQSRQDFSHLFAVTWGISLLVWGLRQLS